MEVSKIVEGFRNDWFPPKELKSMIEKISKERLSICLNCQFNTTPGRIKTWSRCGACGCFLKKKTKCLSCSCGIQSYNQDHPDNQLPLKWLAISSKEEENEIKQYLLKNDSSQHPDMEISDHPEQDG